MIRLASFFRLVSINLKSINRNKNTNWVTRTVIPNSKKVCGDRGSNPSSAFDSVKVEGCLTCVLVFAVTGLIYQYRTWPVVGDRSAGG